MKKIGILFGVLFLSPMVANASEYEKIRQEAYLDAMTISVIKKKENRHAR
jgi:hypothetical protein